MGGEYFLRCIIFFYRMFISVLFISLLCAGCSSKDSHPPSPQSSSKIDEIGGKMMEKLGLQNVGIDWKNLEVLEMDLSPTIKAMESAIESFASVDRPYPYLPYILLLAASKQNYKAQIDHSSKDRVMELYREGIESIHKWAKEGAGKRKIDEMYLRTVPRLGIHAKIMYIELYMAMGTLSALIPESNDLRIAFHQYETLSLVLQRDPAFSMREYMNVIREHLESVIMVASSFDAQSRYSSIPGLGDAIVSSTSNLPYTLMRD